MAFTIDGVPGSIDRADYVALIASLGLDPMRVVHVELTKAGVYATLKAKGENGGDTLDPFERNQVARHRIFIEVRDKPASIKAEVRN